MVTWGVGFSLCGENFFSS